MSRGGPTQIPALTPGQTPRLATPPPLPLAARENVGDTNCRQPLPSSGRIRWAGLPALSLLDKDACGMHTDSIGAAYIIHWQRGSLGAGIEPGNQSGVGGKGRLGLAWQLHSGCLSPGTQALLSPQDVGFYALFTR